ncbi:hypothetical protein Mapa_015471 [Marchantia paleacea]|nr:hypothetical protein Mapa_015471 [Marchantia paleacea]
MLERRRRGKVRQLGRELVVGDGQGGQQRQLGHAVRYGTAQLVVSQNHALQSVQIGHLPWNVTGKLVPIQAQELQVRQGTQRPGDRPADSPGNYRELRQSRQPADGLRQRPFETRRPCRWFSDVQYHHALDAVHHVALHALEGIAGIRRRIRGEIPRREE